MPQTISTKVLDTGITSEHIPLLQAWGEFLATGKPGNKKKMTTSQLRRFFGEIKRIQADFNECKNEVVLLDPKLAYAVGKAKKEARGNEQVAIEDFYKVIVNPMIRQINEDKTKFRHFVQVCEAIVAYHKAKEGE